MFPMIMYVILGTSRHNSIGVFAVACMMTSQILTEVKAHLDVPEDRLADVASATALIAGIYLLMLGVLKLGGLNIFLSDQFVSGFTAGVSVHIGTSQLSGLFGFKMGHYSGVFSVTKPYVDFFPRILDKTDIPTLVFSVISITHILAVKMAIDPFMLRRIHMPFPIEMVKVILSIIVSKLDLQEKSFKVIEHIPNNLPVPHLPVISSILFQMVVVDALAVAIASLTIDVSLGRIWAHEKGYQISANQELFALGCANLFGACFGAFPVGASVPKSSFKFLSGGRTQIASLSDVIFIGVTIVALDTPLEQTSTAILSSLIIVSQESLYASPRVQEFLGNLQNRRRRYRLQEKCWHVRLVTFFSTVFLNVQLGYIYGVIFSLLTLVFKIQMPKTFFLGSIPNTDFYVPIKMYGQATEFPGVKIFHFGGPPHFGNAEFFRSELARRTCFDMKVSKNPVADTSQTKQSSDVV
ncbi:prestin-like [Tropilaelaps mercedesae]|uniref:Prestin-like n=1 Tax=Tropilaelaps mercedesae TaxID=418985 RepID=A0A1V9WZR3_9ACAR|nr:prestin-like [Tropilaelaps mercedesae]